MNYIGSLDYSGMLNERPDSIKAVPHEHGRVNQDQLADIQRRIRDEKQETVIETNEPEEARIKEEQKNQHGRDKGKKDDHQHEEGDGQEKEERYIITSDTDLGQRFDISA